MTRDTARSNPIARALWFVESHFAQEITLDDVAAVAGVSRYHLSRTFGLATGRGLMAYVRGAPAQRGRQGARGRRTRHPGGRARVGLRLARGLHARVPRSVRPHARRRAGARSPHRPSPHGGPSHGRLDADAARSAADRGPARRCSSPASTSATTTPPAPRFPPQWQRFTPHLDHVPGQVGHTAYGVIHNSDDAGHADYLTGVEVKDFSAAAGGVQPAADSGAALRGLHPQGSHLGDPAHLVLDLEQGPARRRARGHRRPGVRALRRALRRPDRHGRGGDLDPDQAVTPRPGSAARIVHDSKLQRVWKPSPS